MDELKRRCPLDWPTGWKRTKIRIRAAFGKVSSRDGAACPSKRSLTAWDGAQRVREELSALGVSDESFLISTNLRTRLDGFPRSDDPEPADPGAAVYWQDKNGKQHCMAIDQYTRVADNLAAIGATLNALRAVKRHGGGAILDRTIEGLRPALPESTKLTWRQTLEFGPNEKLTAEMIRDRRLQFARRYHEQQSGHADLTGGSSAHMGAINAAVDEGLKELEQGAQR
jgi:hypothetical protein